VIAHAGGWDELLIAAGAVLLFLLFRSTKSPREEQPTTGPCLYCGRELGPDVERCPDCGFKALRAKDRAQAPRRARVGD
jgi:DNA-directed RNA polymerase subunit RPC12/RpoP